MAGAAGGQGRQGGGVPGGMEDDEAGHLQARGRGGGGVPRRGPGGEAC